MQTKVLEGFHELPTVDAPRCIPIESVEGRFQDPVLSKVCGCPRHNGIANLLLKLVDLVLQLDCRKLQCNSQESAKLVTVKQFKTRIGGGNH